MCSFSCVRFPPAPDAPRNSSRVGRSAPWVMLDEIVGMTPAEVAEVVQSYPLLLTVAAEHARAVVRWLSDRAGLSPKQVQFGRLLQLFV